MVNKDEYTYLLTYLLSGQVSKLHNSIGIDFSYSKLQDSTVASSLLVFDIPTTHVLGLKTFWPLWWLATLPRLPVSVAIGLKRAGFWPRALDRRTEWLIELRFYVPPATKWVISETFFSANLLAQYWQELIRRWDSERKFFTTISHTYFSCCVRMS